MHAKLTYLYILCCIALMASSCTADAPDIDDVRGAELSFAVSNLSRASESPAFNKFAVYGDMKFPVDNSTIPTVIFNKTEVEYKNNTWSYAGTQYWFPKHEHSFVAVHPLSVLEADNTPQYSNSQLSFTYTIPTTAGNKVSSNSITDIIAATHRRLYNVDDKNSVTTLNFGHLMSKINFAPALDGNMMTDEDYIEFYKFELTGFKTKATFNIVPASRQSNSQTDDRVVEVTRQESEGSLTIEFAQPVKITGNSKNVSLFDDNSALIMLPQSFGADSDAKIVLSYKINKESTIKEIILPLMNREWESGKSYVYKFTITRQAAHFDTTIITDWEVVNVGNIEAR